MWPINLKYESLCAHLLDFCSQMDERYLQDQIQHRDVTRNSCSSQLSFRADPVIHCTGKSRFVSSFAEVFFFSISSSSRLMV